MTDQETLQKALYAIKKLKYLLQDQQKKSFEPIAIIGLSCRFPQAVGKNAYWDILKQGRNVITQIPHERWDLLKGSPEISLRDKDHPYWGGFLSDIDLFDAYYFGISPREATRMDPQHRLLLEVAHEAIEDAGISLDSIAGTNTGVFASLYVSQLAHLQKMDTEMDALYLPTGNAISIAANRISYLFDLRGPSIIVDSACSSSMTSLYLACLNLQNKACDLALVCGAKLNLLPYVNFVLSKAKMLSPDGQCKTFDAHANGYVQGEGVGVIVLKPLSKALLDKDRIYGVIASSVANQDGRTNGLTAPNGLQQESLLKTAYQAANIKPENISYIECHGTGTFLGDPIEIQALGEVVGKKRDAQHPCWIGSVKTNIGHLEPAAGIASVIKVALALKNEKIPPHLNFSEPNPHIAFDKYHLQVPTQLQDWPCYGEVRVAGLSGFGFGGTNAHVVIRDLSDEEKQTSQSFTENDTKIPELFTLSAKSEWALQALIDRWCEYLEKNTTLNIAQLCYNVHVRRNHFSYRLAISCSSVSELNEALRYLKINFSVNDRDNIFISDGKVKHNQPEYSDFQITDIKNLALKYVSNVNINWKKFEAARCYPVIEMPLYPWQHKAYWPPLNSHSIDKVDNAHPLQGKKIASPLHTIQFEFKASLELLPDLKDTYNILHAGYYLEILAFATQEISGQKTFVLEGHQFLAPLIATSNSIITIHLILEPIETDYYLFHFFSNIPSHKNWLHNATGKLKMVAEPVENVDTIEEIKSRCKINESSTQLYEKVISMGMPSGDSIRWTHQYWLGENEILCEFKQPAMTSHNELYTLDIHPSVFDASIQPLFRLLPKELDKPYIASGAKKFTYQGYDKEPLYLWGELKIIEGNGEKLIGDCHLINAQGKVIANLEEIGLTQLANKLHVDAVINQKSELLSKLTTLTVPERKQQLIIFLRTQISVIFSIPEEDLQVDCSLRDLGIDSLMALVLMRSIEVGLESAYPIQELLEGPTINEMAEFLSQSLQEKTVTTEIQTKQNAGRWIAYRKSLFAPSMRLFCFPYGGGGASIYRDWQHELSDNIEVCPIQLPGREERMNEKPLDDFKNLIETLIDNLHNELDIPFAFFGHSFGSLIAFELTRNLRQKNLPMPTHLFVSAFPDPRVPTKSLDRLLQQLKDANLYLSNIDNSKAIELLSSEQLNNLSLIFNENGIMGYGDYLVDKQIIKVLLPIFMGDMNLVKSYIYYDAPLLDIPITVFAGKKDRWVAYEDHLKWVDHTNKSCELVDFDSGHMFIRESLFRNEVISKIANVLTNEELQEIV